MSDRIKAIDWAGTARCLAGHRCKVYFREPSRKNLDGLHYRVNNHSVIELSPRLNERELMWVFLHEVGHARLHFNRLKAHQNELAPNRPAYSTEYLQSPKIAARETDADRLANTWFKFASYQDTLEGKHSVLRSYYDD